MGGIEPPKRIAGVDFSASSREAGRNTWIARGTVDGRELRLERLADAAAALDCGADRDSTIGALVADIRSESGEAAYGLDFPFGLPTTLLEAEQDWRGFIDGVPDRWGDLEDVTDPDSLYDSARDFGSGEERLLRETDAEHGGQEPTGYRIKTQTYYGVSALLAEIVDDASIVPMTRTAGTPLVLETYPACTFERLDGAVRTGYKRDTSTAIEARRRNVAALSKAGVEFGGYEDYALASDDALDAVAAAYATFRATRDPSALEDATETAHREGYIFSGPTGSE